ncbi:MAG TPA: hypothetical protein VHL11_04350 [Phototrophicaceae bacterium]|nr:hypothetical protein [Phototrophicaceae bacterium]
MKHPLERDPGLPDYSTALANIFNFNLDDLEANREGEITVRQDHFLQRRLVPAWRIVLLNVVIAGALPLFLVWFFDQRYFDNQPSTDQGILLAAGLVLLALWSGLMIVIMLQRMLIRRDLRRLEVQSIDGMLQLYHWNTGRGSALFYMTVNQRRFRLTAFQYDQLRLHLMSFEEPPVWRVYYARVLRLYVLSCEPLFLEQP